MARPTKGLRYHPKNARNHDVEGIARSLSTRGQYVPILVQQSTGFVIKGNGTLEAARSMKWREIAAVMLDVDDAEALKILAVDNRASDRASYDPQGQAALLSELARIGSLEDVLYTQADVDALLAEMADTGNRLASEALGAVLGTAAGSSVNPLSDASAPIVATDTVTLIFYFTPAEREEVRSKLAAMGAPTISDALLEAVRSWA